MQLLSGLAGMLRAAVRPFADFGEFVLQRLLEVRFRGANFTLILVVSTIHLLWGGSLILMEANMIPRPFGALEGLFQTMTYGLSGWLLVLSALLPGGMIVCPSKRWMVWFPWSIVPQQLVLFWGIGWALEKMIEGGWDGRAWFGMCQPLVMALFHGIEMVQLYRAAAVASEEFKLDGRSGDDGAD